MNLAHETERALQRLAADIAAIRRMMEEDRGHECPAGGDPLSGISPAHDIVDGKYVPVEG
jgi:hypothetical protein